MGLQFSFDIANCDIKFLILFKVTNCDLKDFRNST